MSEDKKMNDATTTVQELKGVVTEFIAEREWERYHVPKNLTMSIAIEAAELLEIFQWLDSKEAAELGQNDEALRQRVREEIADVASYLLSLCEHMNIDLAQALTEKMAKNRHKYPIDKCLGTDYQKPE